MFVPDRPTGITVQFHCSCNMWKHVFKISWHLLGHLKFACECLEYVYEESNRFSFQVANKYSITVEAKDRGVVKLSSTATIIVNLQDGNNHLPVITGQTVSVKGIVHPNIKILSSFTHPHVVENLHDFLSSVEEQIFWRMLLTKQLLSHWLPLIYIYFFSMHLKSMATSNCLFTNILPNILSNVTRILIFGSTVFTFFHFTRVQLMWWKTQMVHHLSKYIQLMLTHVPLLHGGSDTPYKGIKVATLPSTLIQTPMMESSQWLRYVCTL